jgi:hypothetical protein
MAGHPIVHEFDVSVQDVVGTIAGWRFRFRSRRVLIRHESCTSFDESRVFMRRKVLPRRMSKKEWLRLKPYVKAQETARKFGNPSSAGAKPPSWTAASNGYIKIEATGRFEMNRHRH